MGGKQNRSYTHLPLAGFEVLWDHRVTSIRFVLFDMISFWDTTAGRFHRECGSSPCSWV